jgi:uncharacterized membrane protein YqjE
VRWLIGSLQRIVGELPALVSDRVELLSLELTRAGQALAKIVMLLVGAAVLAVTGWLALWAIGVLVAMRLGMPPEVALLVVVVLNAAVAALALRAVKAQARFISLPATRRRLSFQRLPAEPPSPEPTNTPAQEPPERATGPKTEDEVADPVGDGRADAEFAAAMPQPGATPAGTQAAPPAASESTQRER